MVLAASVTESVSLSVRAGKTLTLDIFVYDETQPSTPELDLRSYSARLQVRDLRGRRRVLINAEESPTAGAVLQRVSMGRWRLFLGKSYTSWLPFRSQVEVDLQNLTVADDVLPLFSGTLNIIPEAVTN